MNNIQAFPILKFVYLSILSYYFIDSEVYLQILTLFLRLDGRLQIGPHQSLLYFT